MNDLISIVIPVYNVEKYLERAVNSVINQTYTNLEIILINDGSKDSSGILCDEIARKDKRIKVIHQENAGLSAARNVGIKNATGKYIGFVDSDDLISDKMYEVLYKSIIDNGSKISMCNYVAFSKENPAFDETYKSEVMTTDETIKELMIDKKVRNFAWNKLFDIELFKNIEFPVGKKFEDVGTTFKLFLEAENIVYVDMKLYGYYIREDSITGNYNKNSTLDFIEMLKYRYDYLMKEKSNLSEYINMNRVNSVTRCFIDIAKSKKLSVLKDDDFKGRLYEELDIAKKLNTKRIKGINSKTSNILNSILFFNPYVFYFIIKNAWLIKNFSISRNTLKTNLFKDKKDLYLNFDKDTQMIIVTGISGSGKSYTSMQLGEKYNYPILSFDNLFNYEENREITDFEEKIISNFKKSNPKYMNGEKVTETSEVCNEFYDFVLNEITKTNTKIIFDGAYFLVRVDFEKFKFQRIVLKRTAFFKSLYRRSKRGIKFIRNNNSNIFKVMRGTLSLQKYIVINANSWRKDQDVFLKNCQKIV